MKALPTLPEILPLDDVRAQELMADLLTLAAQPQAGGGQRLPRLEQAPADQAEHDQQATQRQTQPAMQAKPELTPGSSQTHPPQNLRLTAP